MKVSILLVAVTLIAAGVASAQIVSPVTFKMETAFEVGNTALPAGNYEIAPTDDPSILELRGANGTPSVLFEVTGLDSITPFKQTELVFNKYGNTMVLKSVKVEGEDLGATTVTSQLERRHVKSYGKATRMSHMAMKKKVS